MFIVSPFIEILEIIYFFSIARNIVALYAGTDKSSLYVNDDVDADVKLANRQRNMSRADGLTIVTAKRVTTTRGHLLRILEILFILTGLPEYLIILLQCEIKVSEKVCI